MTYHSNEHIHNKAYLEGYIRGQKRIIEINTESGLYKPWPEKEIEDKYYLKGLEKALEIMERKI
ncbi:MAG: hypothetical protein ACRCX2_10750 [Paraclostridium sp.]